MSDTVIRVENLSKKYIIRHQQAQQYTALRDVIADGVKSIGRRLSGAKQDPSMGSTQEEFWALKDVSFEVKQGDRIGIIGRNGAGKSTLLKILSRITEPTTGEITLNGRVASLLEVGTGFHPELTGRENVFLNGAILGMSKIEIKQKFDEIIDFAEVEKFLDTPVKHYSSGMYVRLAFSVAAHLEPEVLVVDEVLAVGDMKFQKKCLEKMEAASNTQGRTILLVSHQMAAIQNLCNKAILLDHGKILKIGDVDLVIKEYFNKMEDFSKQSLSSRQDRQGTGDIQFLSVVLQNHNEEAVNYFQIGQSIKIKFYFKNSLNKDLINLNFALGINNSIGERVTILSNELCGNYFPELKSNINFIEIKINKLPLIQGRYTFTIYCAINGIVADWIQNTGFFDVVDGDYYGTGRSMPKSQGYFLVDHQFKVIKNSTIDHEI
jgi:lipopolysaccharide transport system ATP-binding protein